MDTLQPGQMLGSYRIISQVGKGGMATVYKAYQPSMDRNVAIKVLPRQLAESPEFAARFQQEARIIARLEHPHILPVFDFGESDGVTYFVMRYLEAGTLKTKMEAGLLSLNEIDRLFTQLAEALNYAHGHGIVHRDLKPANALIDSDGNLFLTDFGIAKLLESASPRLTQTDAILGTPAYISPEQAKAESINQRSDIYSLGIILYEMVTGSVPFVADTPLAVILKHISDPLPPPSIIKKDLPEPIEQVILKALAKDPSDRYATAAEFLSAWKRALEETGTARHTPDSKPAPASHTWTPNEQTQGMPAPAPSTAPASSRGYTGWIVGCLAVVCLVFGVAGIGILFLNWKTPAFLTPATSTPFPTQPPPPTETAAPISNVLLQDDFSQNDQWGTLTNTDYSIEYDGEALRMKVFQQTSWFVWSTTSDTAYENIHIEVTATNNDGESSTAFGIMCHLQATSDSYYYLVITPGGNYAIALTKEGETDLFLTNNDQWGHSDLIVENKATYRIGADCGNGRLTLYVDGQQIASVTDGTFASGIVGLYAWSGEDVRTADVTFDDFIVTTLE
ncbi:MAG: serine/threonine protein kinase [Anaerolineae bacterium]|nr:serine/threonine protein kinase [Anaerolineae bacterium]MBL8104984.1 serine/threonine protein kinase [Anaerolineales bacterium]MCC7188154.1 serine/threonine protein kinase [Anaerolineales bacterium]